MEAPPKVDPPISDDRNDSRRDLPGRTERHFLVTARGSTPGREILAGLTTFVAMVYIVAVNPAIMAHAGMNRADVASATILVAIVGCMAMGILANLPLGLAPSMGSNSFFAFVLVGQMGLSWQAGLTVMLGCGLTIFMLGLLGIRERMTRGIPHDLKIGLNLAFGLFLCRIAVAQAGFLSGLDTRPDGRLIAVLLVATIATFGLAARRIPGTVILSVLLTTFAYAFASTQTTPGWPALLLPAWPHWPRETAFAIDVGLLAANPLEAFVALAFVTFNECVGLIATTLTVTRSAGLDLAGGVRAAYLSDASATVLGALLGTATVSPYVESIAGVEAGGRTGLTAMTAGAGFVATLFFIPLFSSIPPIATTPALILLGGLMALRSIGQLAGEDLASLTTSAAMGGVALASGNLADALAAGMVAYLVTRWQTGGMSWLARSLYLLFVIVWSVSKFAV